MTKVSVPLRPIEPLDLKKCKTVSDIVLGMELCSFGARMLGEVTSTLNNWIHDTKKPLIIFDDKLDTPLGMLLQLWVKRGWFESVIGPQDCQPLALKDKKILIIGYCNKELLSQIEKGANSIIFINRFDIASEGQIIDGYFPNAVFNDPNFVIPTIDATLRERALNEKVKIEELFDNLCIYGGLGFNVARGAEVFRIMVEDKDCTVFLTVSGAMTIAKMGLIICDMIDTGMVQCVSSTGALMVHGLVEGVGLEHYKYDPKVSDKVLAKKKLNRVTDTLEPETNLDYIENLIDTILQDVKEEIISPSYLHGLIGKYLKDNFPNDRAILKSAYENNIQVFVPAFHDSEIGNDLYLHNQKRKREGRKKILMDIELDTEKLIDIAVNSNKLGLFTIGGGVPRNNTQNVAPLIEILNNRLDLGLPDSKFSYGVRICPDKMYYGHLSGCTYEEGMSWRKMDTSGEFVGIISGATQIWPFIIKYVMEKVYE